MTESTSPVAAAPAVADPPAPEPDDKDWTWVLHRPCLECGYQAGIAPVEVAGVIRSHLPRWREVLARPDVAQRPAPTTWSPLEYACHVRDVYRLFRQRLELMLDTDDPTFANWDQDVAAIESRYWEADPTAVADELTAAGTALADAFAAVQGAQWQRPGRRSNGSVFTVETFAWYLLHDDVHHLVDTAG